MPKSVDKRQKLQVTVNGIPVRGSPFRPELTAGPVAAKACTASGQRLYDSVAGEETTVVVQARDALVAGILDDFRRIAEGTPLPPLGEGTVCEHCTARGLCRKDFWSDDAGAAVLQGSTP